MDPRPYLWFEREHTFRMNDLRNRLNFSFAPKLPIILQTEVTECGLACLAMIVNFHGYQTDLLTLRRNFSVSLRGSTLQDLIDIGGKLHFLSRALKLDLEDLKLLKTPCILHWDLDHFVVLKKVQGDIVAIHDPAVGLVKYKMSEISEHFTGVALELIPAANFEKKTDKTTLYLSDLWSSFVGIKRQLIQILLISIALEIFEIISPLFMQFVTDEVIVANDFPLLYVLVMGFGLLMAMSALTNYVRSYIILFLSNTLNLQLVVNLFHHLFKLPLSFFEKRHMGDIVSRFESTTLIQEKLSTDFVVGVVDGLMIIITLIMMFMYSPSLTAVVLFALLIYVVVRAALYPKIKLQNQEVVITSAKEQSVFMESVRSILPLKVFSKETLREHLWQNHYIDKLNAGIRLSKLTFLYRLIMQFIFGLEHIVIISLGARAIMSKEGFTIGMLIAYLAYRHQFVSKAQEMVEKIIQYQIIKIHLQRIADIALTDPDPSTLEDATYKKEIQGELSVKDLAFRYSDKDPYIFKGLSFHVRKGEVFVMVGPSGCGKTTLLKVLLGLLLPSEGNISIDGMDVHKMGLQNYRSQIAAVMQEDTLLSGSIAENISFFDPTPDFDRVYTCAMMAAVHDEITAMTMGYQSLVGDMGSALSGGQRQRILLARALYARPKIIFLDEATSNLDIHNEDVINTNIKRLGITRIIISHRKEVVKIADQLIELQ